MKTIKELKISPYLLSRKQAAEYLGIGLNTFSLQDIPKIQIRRRVLYRRDILEQWAINQTEKAKVVSDDK